MTQANLEDRLCLHNKIKQSKETMWPPLKLSCDRSDYIVLSVHHSLYKGPQCILDMMHPSPGICLPCLAGHLTLLSLLLCCHGNSSVTGPGWA